MSVSTTYAEALYEAAVAENQLSDVATQLATVRAAVAETPELNMLLRDPDVDTPAKKRVLAQLLQGANPLVANFVQVLLDRGRADELEQIGEAFDKRVAAAEGRLRVVVRTAIPLPDDLRADVIARIERNSGGPVDVETVVDESIVGGVVIETDTAVVDASVRKSLESLERSMSGASVQAAVAAQ